MLDSMEELITNMNDNQKETTKYFKTKKINIHQIEHKDEEVMNINWWFTHSVIVNEKSTTIFVLLFYLSWWWGDNVIWNWKARIWLRLYYPVIPENLKRTWKKAWFYAGGKRRH